MRILAISGSLRASSSNTALLRAAIALAPPGVEVTLYDGLGDLPHFNPDLDGDTVSPPVNDWRARLQAADGVVFSVPEYAHGVPGVLKNALDWVVGSGEFMDKPVTLFNASPRGTYAQASLTETLTAMTARLVPAASITLQHLGMPLNAEQIAADPKMSAAVRSALRSFAIDVSERFYKSQ
jgi:chromate reductase